MIALAGIQLPTPGWPELLFDSEELDALVADPERGIEQVTLLDNGGQTLVAYPASAGPVLVVRIPTVGEVLTGSYWSLNWTSSSLDPGQFPLRVLHIAFTWVPARDWEERS